jgi:hypothetical protein
VELPAMSSMVGLVLATANRIFTKCNITLKISEGKAALKPVGKFTRAEVNQQG